MISSFNCVSVIVAYFKSEIVKLLNKLDTKIYFKF